MADTDFDFDDLFQQVMASPQVQGAVMDRAARIAARARQIDQRDGRGTADITVEPRHLASGRAAFDVVSRDPSSEYGTHEVPRIRALRRAAREVRR
mgnify:CR=1 FL=1